VGKRTPDLGRVQLPEPRQIPERISLGFLGSIKEAGEVRLERPGNPRQLMFARLKAGIFVELTLS
jgi:hypothetical protein